MHYLDVLIQKYIIIEGYLIYILNKLMMCQKIIVLILFP